jgi:hypothetical protein
MSGGSPRNIRPAFTAEEAIVVERALARFYTQSVYPRPTVASAERELKRAVTAAATPDAV